MRGWLQLAKLHKLKEVKFEENIPVQTIPAEKERTKVEVRRMLAHASVEIGLQ